MMRPPYQRQYTPWLDLQCLPVWLQCSKQNDRRARCSHRRPEARDLARTGKPIEAADGQGFGPAEDWRKP